MKVARDTDLLRLALAEALAEVERLKDHVHATVFRDRDGRSVQFETWTVRHGTNYYISLREAERRRHHGPVNYCSNLCFEEGEPME